MENLSVEGGGSLIWDFSVGSPEWAFVRNPSVRMVFFCLFVFCFFFFSSGLVRLIIEQCLGKDLASGVSLNVEEALHLAF